MQNLISNLELIYAPKDLSPNEKTGRESKTSDF